MPSRSRAARKCRSAWGSSPYGVCWQGRGTVRQRLGPTTPVAGDYAAGANATPGAGLAYVGLGAALVATLIAGIYPAWKAGRVAPVETIRLV